MKHSIPMNLQLFADGGTDGGANEAGNEAGGGKAENGPDSGQQSNQSTQIDYDKIAGLIAGKQQVAEDTVLKNYFKQQGLSKDEADQAINTFKEQKKANEPDADALQAQLAQVQEAVNRANIEKEGIILGIEMGIEAKAVPYILKMAEVKDVIKDGTVDKEALKKAINEVLDVLPGLKSSHDEGKGFKQVGSAGGASDGGDQAAILAGIFGNTQ